jgi:hypothetical protein
MEPTLLFAEATHVRLLRRARLIRVEDRHEAARRCVVLIALAWLPLALLVLTQPGAASLFFRDITAQVRYLVALPLLVIADYIVLPRAEALGRYFLESSLLPLSRRDEYRTMASAVRRRSSGLATALCIAAVVYASMFTMYLVLPAAQWAAWQRQTGTGAFSLAGWWHLLVSLPMLMGLILSWAWRWLLWVRLMWWLAHAGLVLVPAHPDGAAGLGFLADSPRMFIPVVIPLAVVVAATLGHSLVLEGVSAVGHEATPLITAGMAIAVFASPPLLFARVLVAVRHDGMLEYGELCRNMGLVFEQRWLGARTPVNTDALERPDFSSTTDLYGIAANAFEMKLLLVDYPTLAALAVASVLPFAPLWLAAVPFHAVVDHIVGMLV